MPKRGVVTNGAVEGNVYRKIQRQNQNKDNLLILKHVQYQHFSN